MVRKRHSGKPWSARTGMGLGRLCLRIFLSGNMLNTHDAPAGMSRGSFNRARWACDGSLGLYTAVNAAGIGYILHWEQVPTIKTAVSCFTSI